MTTNERPNNERSTVVGVFEMRSEADAAIHELQEAGFRDDQIGFVVRNGEHGVENGTNEMETGSGAVAGVVSGGIIGGVVGAAAALLVPGVGPAIAGGILIAILGGVVFGAAAGGILGALMGMGIPEEEARYYESEFSSGRTIITVQTTDRQQEATSILHRNGGYDAGTRFAQVEAQAPVLHVNSTGSPEPEPEPEADSSTMESPLPSQQSQQTQQQPQQAPATNESSRHYDPITGVEQEGQESQERQRVPAGGYGLQRDPAVETDATEGTIDTQVRPGTAVEKGSSDSLFESPVEPGVVQPGGVNDPNVRPPRVP